MAKITVTLNNAVIAVLDKAKKQALEMTAEAILSDIRLSAVTPKETGELERSGFVDSSQLDKFVTSIIFDTSYARRLYWHPELNFRTDKNRNAQGEWMQQYIDGDKKDFARDTYIKFFRQLTGGIVR